MDYRGHVNNIDVFAPDDEPIRCYAIIGQDKDDYVQVTAIYHQLQTALELASAKNVEVEVSYIERDDQKILQRVRLLDRLVK